MEKDEKEKRLYFTLRSSSTAYFLFSFFFLKNPVSFFYNQVRYDSLLSNLAPNNSLFARRMKIIYLPVSIQSIQSAVDRQMCRWRSKRRQRIGGDAAQDSTHSQGVSGWLVSGTSRDSQAACLFYEAHSPIRNSETRLLSVAFAFASSGKFRRSYTIYFLLLRDSACPNQSLDDAGIFER